MTQPNTEPERKPYAPPAIKFEKRIEAFASACTCNTEQKTGPGSTAFMATDESVKCGADNYS